MAESKIPIIVPQSEISLSNTITFHNATNYNNNTFLLKSGIICCLNLFISVNDTTTDITNWIPLLSCGGLNPNYSHRFVIYNATKNKASACRFERQYVYLNPTDISVGDVLYGSVMCM